MSLIPAVCTQCGAKLEVNPAQDTVESDSFDNLYDEDATYPDGSEDVAPEPDELVIEEGVTGIGDSAFASSEFTSVKIPRSVRFIGNNAFGNCSFLSSVTIGNGNLETVGNQAFYNCDMLSEITIPAKTKSIGAEAFAYSGLEKIVFSGDCSIGQDAFYNCGFYYALKIVIPPDWQQGTEVWCGGREVTYEVATTGSVLSEGSITIICSVACLAVGFLAATLIFKKKKPALADGADKTDEE